MYPSESACKQQETLGCVKHSSFLNPVFVNWAYQPLFCEPVPRPVPDLAFPLHSGLTWKDTSALFLLRTQKAPLVSENGQNEAEEKDDDAICSSRSLSDLSPHKVSWFIINPFHSVFLQHFYLSSPRESSTPSVRAEITVQVWSLTPRYIIVSPNESS